VSAPVRGGRWAEKTVKVVQHIEDDDRAVREIRPLGHGVGRPLELVFDDPGEALARQERVRREHAAEHEEGARRCRNPRNPGRPRRALRIQGLAQELSDEPTMPRPIQNA
jgi:hypothetical protein